MKFAEWFGRVLAAITWEVLLLFSIGGLIEFVRLMF